MDGTTGVLVFDIKEGPQAQITSVVWAGVSDTRLPAVQKAAELAVPAPYVAADVNSARIRIENEYRRQGFNDAGVPGDSIIVALCQHLATRQNGDAVRQ